MVGIYAKIANGTGDWIRALEIPLEDIRRLTYRPLKWLRFVAFAVLGAEGHLHSDNSGDAGTLVEYETVDGLAEDYYFFPQGDISPVDPQGLNDRNLSVSSSCLTSFRPSISQRDGGHCAITRYPWWQSAHIIPHLKGDLYIQYIISQRRTLYGLDPAETNDIGIDSPENGVSLKVDLHERFGNAESVFLMTPNFALVPGDIPMVEYGEMCPRPEGGEMPPSRTTFQHVEQPSDPYVAPQLDVIPDWSIPNTNAPLRLLLDYAYGVAAIKHWASEEVWGILNSRHENNYKPQIKKKSSRSTPSRKDGDAAKPDYPTTSSTRPGNALRSARRVGADHTSEPEDSGMSRAMDTAFQFALLFRGGPYKLGTTFDTMHQQQEEKAKKHLQQVSQDKVREWLGTNETN